jgi:hypothetical protein
MNARRIFVLLLVFSAFGLSSCLPLDNPLSDPDKAQPDTKLLGAWKGIGKKEQRAGFALLLISKSGVDDAPPGILKWVASEVDKEKDLRTKIPQYIFPTPLGDNHYLHVINPAGLGIGRDQPFTWSNRNLKSYSLFKYQVAEDKLTIWRGDHKAVEAAIKKGQVQGTINHQKAPAVDLTGGEDLAKFLTNGGDKLFFPAKPEYQLEFTRIK